MEQVLEEFDEAEDDRQHELLALSEKVLQFVRMMEPYLTIGGQGDVTPIAETIGSMVHSLECFERTTRVRGRPWINCIIRTKRVTTSGSPASASA